jgi:hypothetical protein
MVLTLTERKELTKEGRKEGRKEELNQMRDCCEIYYSMGQHSVVSGINGRFSCRHLPYPPVSCLALHPPSYHPPLPCPPFTSLPTSHSPPPHPSPSLSSPPLANYSPLTQPPLLFRFPSFPYLSLSFVSFITVIYFVSHSTYD